jgi:hypothetical protein
LTVFEFGSSQIVRSSFPSTFMIGYIYRTQAVL